MQDLILWAIGVVITVGGSAIGWIMGMIFGKFKEHEEVHMDLERKIDDHRLDVARNYTTKTDVKDMENNIVAHLIRIEEKLDKKADK